MMTSSMVTQEMAWGSSLEPEFAPDAEVCHRVLDGLNVEKVE